MNSCLLHINAMKFFSLTVLAAIFLSLMFGIGCNGSGGNGGEEQTSVSRKLFVADWEGNKISVFEVEEVLNADASEDANVNVDANVLPTRTIGSNAGLFSPIGVFVDTDNNQIFVANHTNNTNTITVYGRTDEGDVTPIQTIQGEELNHPFGIFVDSDFIFVTNYGNSTIVVYERTGESDFTLLKIIEGDDTRLSSPRGIFVDAENNEIFVANSGFDFENNTAVIYVTVYDRGEVANTNGGIISPMPIRAPLVIDSDDSGLNELNLPGIFVDVENNKLFVVEYVTPLIPLPFPIQRPTKSTIKVYEREDEGNALPLRKIEGEHTGLFRPNGIYVDTERDEIFVINSFNNTVTVYDKGVIDDVAGEENIPPLRTLAIKDTNNAGIRGTRNENSGIFVDAVNDELFVSSENNTVTVYGRTAEGSAQPLRTIGPRTGLLEPRWVFVDTLSNEIFVSNSLSRTITVYGITDEGNTPPLRTIPLGLLSPNGIFVDDGEIFVANEVNNAITVHRSTDGAFLRSIFGSNTGLSSPVGIFVDAENIFVTNSSFGESKITVYNKTDNGNVCPSGIIEGPNTKLSLPKGIFVENGEIFVADSGDDTVKVYNNADINREGVCPSETDLNPSLTLSTGLFAPSGIFVDADNIFVSNRNTITIYKRAGGDNPIIIEAGKMGLVSTAGIFVVDSP